MSNKEAVLVDVVEKAVTPSVPGQKGEEICTVVFGVETLETVDPYPIAKWWDDLG